MVALLMVVALMILPVLVPKESGPAPTGSPTPAEEPPLTYQGDDAITLRLVSDTRGAPRDVRVAAWAGEQVLARHSGRLPLALDVPGDTSVWVVVEAPGRARFAQEIVATADREIRVPLPPGGAIRGIVVDAEGEPLLASLRITREDGGSGPWTAQTGEDGAFVVDTLLPGGTYRLVASAEGHATGARTGLEPDAAPLRITLEPAATVAGRVMGPDGAPYPDATVVIAGSGLWPARQVETDARGAFALPDIPPGVYEVRTFAGGLVATPRRGLGVEAAARVFLTFALREGAALHGLVLDATTRDPIAGAEVTLAAQALDVAPRAATTDAAGRFAIRGVEEIPHQVSVHAEGYVAITAREWSPGQRLELLLERAAVLVGVVLDPDGRPVEGATLEVLGEDTAQQPVDLTEARGFRSAVFASQLTPIEPMALEVVPGPVPPIPIDAIASTGEALGGVLAPLTDVERAVAASHVSAADGTFRIEGVPPGRVQIVARHQGFAPATTARLFVAAGAVQEGIELVLSPAGRLIGRVVDAREVGVDAVLVEVRSDREPHPSVTFTDPRGRFELDGVIGELTVTAIPQGRPAVRTRAEVVAERDTEVTLVLEGEVVTLRGRTVDGRGFPIPTVQLTVSSLRADAPLRRTVFSGDDGTFELPGLAAPPWRIEASAPERVPARLDVFDAHVEAAVVLAEGARVTGSVIDDYTGEPVRARVTLVRDDLPPERLAAESADGSFSFARVRPGTWTLTVESPTHLEAAREVVVDVRGGTPRDVELDPVRLPPAGSLSGSVVDALGAPVARATVEAEGAAPVETDTDGTFTLRGVAPGMVAAHAAHPAAGEASARGTRVVGGEDSPGVVIRLPQRFDPARAEALPSRRRGVAATVAWVGGEARLRAVIEDSGAARAGLRAGDVLLEVDGVAPESARQASALLAGAPSVPAMMRIRRGDREAHLVVEREAWLSP